MRAGGYTKVSTTRHVASYDCQKSVSSGLLRRTTLAHQRLCLFDWVSRGQPLAKGEPSLLPVAKPANPRCEKLAGLALLRKIIYTKHVAAVAPPPTPRVENTR